MIKPTLALAALMISAISSLSAHVAASPVDEPSDTPDRPQVMLLATHHLNNNNRDMINLPIEDVLTPKRQAEMEQLVDNLARWKPTKIVLEWDHADQAGLSQEYQAYRDGKRALTANERDQIGLRLAKLLGHSEVYAADWNKSAPGEWASYDFLTWAQENGEEERLKRFVEEGQAALDRKAERMRGQSIVEWYLDLNTPEARAADHRQYFEIARFGDQANNPGAAWVGGWYARNLRIFNNLTEHFQPGERVLVLYGSGHVYHLDRFVRETEAAELVDPRDFIRAAN